MAKAKVKTLLGTGLAALCSHIKQCNTALGDLSEATANGFEETDDILHEKQDVTAAVSFTIPVDGWGEDDSSPGYFYCDIPIAGLLATDIVDVTVLPEFYDVAGAVGCIATESPSESRSTQSRPSGLSITSTIAGSSRNRAIAGPRAVRSMRAPRRIASDFW